MNQKYANGHASSLRDRILKAARDLFLNKGYFGTTTGKIAADAGTSESGIFRLFPNGKYEVLMAVYDDCWKEVNSEIETHLPVKDEDPRRELLEILRIVWSLYETKPLLMSFIIINTGNTDTLLVAKQEKAIITDANVRYIQRINELCEECERRKLLPKGLTARAVREALLGLTEGILLGWYLADKETKGRYPEKVPIDEAVAAAAVVVNGSYVKRKIKRTRRIKEETKSS